MKRITLEAVLKENELLRAAIANGSGACMYCQLAAAEIDKCASGFPGCARADDAVGCPEFGAAMQFAELKALCEKATQAESTESKLACLKEINAWLIGAAL